MQNRIMGQSKTEHGANLLRDKFLTRVWKAKERTGRAGTVNDRSYYVAILFQL